MTSARSFVIHPRTSASASSSTWRVPSGGICVAGKRDAMRNARVGDDVCGEDPTVDELERVAAALLGKEAGLFVPELRTGDLVRVRSTGGTDQRSPPSTTIRRVFRPSAPVQS